MATCTGCGTSTRQVTVEEFVDYFNQDPIESVPLEYQRNKEGYDILLDGGLYTFSSEEFERLKRLLPDIIFIEDMNDDEREAAEFNMWRKGEPPYAKESMENDMLNDWVPETRSLIISLQKAGFEIKGGNNGEDKFKFTGDLKKFIDELIACDEAVLYVVDPTTKKQRWISLVLGNNPGEIASDYSIPAGTPEPDLLDTVTNAHYEKWQSRKQPKISKYDKYPDVYKRPAPQPSVENLVKEILNNDKMEPLFDEGTRIKLKGNQEQNLPEETGVYLGPSGNRINDCHVVRVDDKYCQDKNDDGLREVTTDQIEKA